ncbi:hypothetical protein SARC_07359 [Sphaeroforma arctica JP610]|uniref:Uncharacterized protein n=1 Tax=Sphaeroforma arctica JP610 TaxID=667725 RepID=A0A0L0FUE6_9EUKA|nr:hypothetical protein SARC_07359 [Sphaeroforma arctica JP610]KNC80279.1 hypothetical protein SARC_07359 [Sphaeroforma arctica JP610]|eukprot:XP_014154181.1 hypothetical protein SARC_07359 [Sphaeroforma arctica JP610]
MSDCMYFTTDVMVKQDGAGTTKVSLVVDDNGVHIHRMDGTPCVNIIYQEITSIDHRRDAKDLMGEKNFLAFRLRDSTSIIVSSADTRLIKNDVMKRVGPKLTVGSVLRNYSKDNITEA